LKRQPALSDLATDQQDDGLGAHLAIDRVTASRLGITATTIDNTLYDAFGQRQVSTMFTQLNQYHVILEVAPEFQRDPATLQNIYVSGANGSQIPLSAFTRFDPTTAPLTVNHQGQFPAVTVSFNLAPGYSLGEAVAAIETAQRRIGMPASVQAAFQGNAAAFGASLSSEPMLILAALIVVYIVLGILYESYIHPITILSTLPSAGVGAILALLICRMELDVVALIGIILLIGIVKKNAIMMIDFRPRGAARGRQIRRRSHLPGLPNALSADHDDHDSGVAGRPPARRRHWRGIGAATSAGGGDRRRSAAQPSADALYHPGYFSLLRAARREARIKPEDQEELHLAARAQ
jgi:multidrug efflux pump subunit AcrB